MRWRPLWWPYAGSFGVSARISAMGLHDRDYYREALKQNERLIQTPVKRSALVVYFPFFRSVDSTIVKAAAWIIVIAAVFVLVWAARGGNVSHLPVDAAASAEVVVPAASNPAFRWSKQ